MALSLGAPCGPPFLIPAFQAVLETGLWPSSPGLDLPPAFQSLSLGPSVLDTGLVSLLSMRAA
eukprot:8656578-Alexandrium_andersonii.AAC.1